MRELHLSEEESTDTFLVLFDDDGVRYQLARAELHADAPRPGGSTLVAVPDAGSAPDADAAAAADTAEGAPAERTLPEPDPLFATALSMRPNEIQARVRSGATTAQLAEEMGVAESRVEPYAHPVLLERAQVAEAAKLSHPLREGSPAKLTLFEILASAFAARGHSLADATWDATRDPGDAWVVRLQWKAGLTDNEALWSYRRQMGSAAITEARNAVAADLTDPDFVQPVRSLTAVDNRIAAVHRFAAESDEPDADSLTDSRDSVDGDGDGTTLEGDFLRHPDEDDQPQKRRRKAVTPHWEDVLLGVRTTPKRPKK